MALFVRGKTICPLCGKVILTNEAVVSFPAFLKKTHTLARYSDAAFHQECFDNSPDGGAVSKLFDRYHQIWESRPQGLKTRKEIDEWGESAFADFE
jgi:hypothetical protein